MMTWSGQRRALVAVFSALIAGCAAPAASGDGPAMWRVSDDDSAVYLFGTFHILPRGHQWTTPAFADAMAGTAVTITEADVASPAAQAELSRLVTDLGINPPGVTLTSTLGPARAEALGRIAARYGVSMRELDPLRPWLAMVSLTQSAMTKSGFAAGAGADEAVVATANREGDRIDHLETAAFQIRALASLDEEELLGEFDASIEQFEDFDAFAKEMLRAWTKGDVEALERELVAPLRRESPDAYRIMFADRNKTWTDKIAAMLDKDEEAFIAVGAGHLVGEESVVALLNARRFKIERLQ